MFDLGEKKKKKITKNTRLFAPDLSSDGRQIVAVEIEENLDQSLVILSSLDGSLIKRITFDQRVILSFPRWMEDNTNIAFVKTENQRSKIIQYDLETETTLFESPYLPGQISHLFPHKKDIFFSADVDNTQNIFCLEGLNRGIYKVTEAVLGAFQPAISPDGKKLVYSEFSAKGFDIKYQQINRNEWQRIDVQKENTPYYSKIIEGQEGGDILDDLPDNEYEITRYNKLSGLIKPHSLLVEIQDPVLDLKVLSDNKFSTLSAQIGARYNYNEAEWSYNVGLTYAELFPVIHASFVHANRSGEFFNFSALSDTSLVFTNFIETWSEDRSSIGLSIPLNLSAGNFLTNLQVSGHYRYISLDVNDGFNDPSSSLRDTSYFENPDPRLEEVYSDPIYNTTFHAIDLGFGFSSVKRRAIQNLQTRIGISLGLRYRGNLSEKDLGGNVLLTTASVFLPGLQRNHGITLNFMMQDEQVLDNYRFSDLFSYPNGYSRNIIADRITKFSVNYVFPLLYPDIAIGPLAFIKRIKAKLFFDYGRVELNSFPFIPTTMDMRSTGIDLGIDLRVLRRLEVDMGIRYSYLMDEFFRFGKSPHQFEFFVISITE